MATVRERLARVAPWIDPILELLDWKKSIIAAVAALVVAGWSFVRDLSAPVIVTLALTVLVQTLYLLYFPAFLKIIRSGIVVRPDYSIWKHKHRFYLYEAACLLAGASPVVPAEMDAASEAWLSVLTDAVRDNQLKRLIDQYAAAADRFPDEYTSVSAGDLKAFCETKGRKPEFLNA